MRMPRDDGPVLLRFKNDSQSTTKSALRSREIHAPKHLREKKDDEHR